MASQPHPQLPAQDQTELSDQPQLPAPIRTAQDLRKEAPTAVKEKYRAAVPAASSLPLAGVGSRVWQVAMLVIPILLTAWLTHVSSLSEGRVTTKIAQQMDQQKQLFAEQVQLSQDLYKRQFDTYDKLYTHLITLEEAIEQLDAGSSPVPWNRRLRDSLFALDSLRRANWLHLSDPVNKSMGDAWMAGVRKNRAEFKQDLTSVEMQMKSELSDLMALPETRKDATGAKLGDSLPKN